MIAARTAPPMTPSRRLILATLMAASGSALTGCGGRANPPRDPKGLDFGRLRAGFDHIAQRARPGIFNLGVMTLRIPVVWCADENARFPMQDLFMLPLAAAALAEVDAGRLKLNDRLEVRATDLSPPPSKVNRAFVAAGGRLSLPAADLIALAVQAGDDTAADGLMSRIGGPGAVNAWLRLHDINDMRVDRYARELAADVAGLTSFRPEWRDEAAWTKARSDVPPGTREGAMTAYLADPRDTTSAQAALNFLSKLADGRLLSQASTAFLLRLMSHAEGPARLGAGLPRGAAFAHETGSAPTDLGFTPATADMGIVTLPGGRRFAIAAFLSGSTATAPQREALFADAARLAVSAQIASS